MKLEEGKFYRTSHGEKVGPASFRRDAERPVAWRVPTPTDKPLFYNEDGVICVNHVEWNIVAEWEDDKPVTLDVQTVDRIAIDSLRFHATDDGDMDPLTREAFRIVLRYYGESME